MAVVLKSPVEIDRDWEYNWFDSAHNHSLLLHDSYFYIINYDDNNPTPKLFYHETKLPSKLILAKISLDMKLIAIQVKLTSILIVDTSKKRKWTVDIKYSNDNYILPFGLIWSEHGGNSQDLIIVTSRGLELYKISEIRGQCKLSRAITLNAGSFWYEPTHRVILLATQRKVSSSSVSFRNSIGTPTREILLMDAFFFKTEKSGIPLLELPPPDRVPQFELGPGVKPDDIALVALYGRVLCLVRYTDNSQASDFVTVYQLNKQKVERIRYLHLGNLTRGLRFSVYDNLLLCHCLTEQITLVFDILNSSRQPATGSTIEIVNAIGSPSPMHYMHVLISKKNMMCGSVDSGTVATEKVEETREHSADNIVDYGNINRDNGDSNGDWAAPLTTPSKASTMFECRLKALGPTDAVIRSYENLTFVPSKLGSTLDRSERMENMNKSKSRDSFGSLASTASARSVYEMLDETLPAKQVYNCSDRNGGVYQYFYPFWLLDTANNEMWRIECDFEQLLARAKGKYDLNTKEFMSCLSRRGLMFGALRTAAGDKLLDYQYVTVYGRKAKQKILCTLLDAISEQQPKGKLEELISVLIRPYINESRRLLQIHNSDSVDAINVIPPSPASTPSEKVAFQRTQSIGMESDNYVIANRRFSRLSVTAVNAFSTSSGGVGFGNNSHLATPVATKGGAIINSGHVPNSSSTSMFSIISSFNEYELSGSTALNMWMEYDPLEPGSAMQLFLPDIAMFGVRARKLQYLSQSKSPNHADQNSNKKEIQKAAQNLHGFDAVQFKVQPTCQSLPLITRRDIYGNLITTQAEILSHVWLPIVLNSNVDLDYCAGALSSFVLVLREHDVTIIPPLSILLMNVLFHCHRYTELSQLIQLNLLGDVAEVAMTGLEFSDMLFDHNQNLIKKLQNMNIPDNKDFDSIRRNATSQEILQQASIDMLFRLNELAVIVKWYLNHGYIIEAIELSKPKKGSWRPGLYPGCISGTEFFLGAIGALKMVHREFLDYANLFGSTCDGNEVVFVDYQARDGAVDVVGNTSHQSSAVELPPTDIAFHEARTALLDRSAEVMYLLFGFLKEWDPSLLTIFSTNGNSKLSTQVKFPDDLFSSTARINLRILFGFDSV